MNIAQITDPVMRLLRPILPHVTFIIILLYLVAIGAAMLTTQAVLSRPSDDAYRTAQKAKFTQSSFDAQAIEKVETLRDDLSNSDIDLSSKRASPFQ